MSGANFFSSLFGTNTNKEPENGFADLMEMMKEVKTKLPATHQNNQSIGQFQSLQSETKETQNQVANFDIDEDELNDGWGENISDINEDDDNLKEEKDRKNEQPQIDFTNIFNIANSQQQQQQQQGNNWGSKRLQDKKNDLYKIEEESQCDKSYQDQNSVSYNNSEQQFNNQYESKQIDKTKNKGNTIQYESQTDSQKKDNQNSFRTLFDQLPSIANNIQEPSKNTYQGFRNQTKIHQNIDNIQQQNQGYVSKQNFNKGNDHVEIEKSKENILQEKVEVKQNVRKLKQKSVEYNSEYIRQISEMQNLLFQEKLEMQQNLQSRFNQVQMWEEDLKLRQESLNKQLEEKMIIDKKIEIKRAILKDENEILKFIEAQKQVEKLQQNLDSTIKAHHQQLSSLQKEKQDLEQFSMQKNLEQSREIKQINDKYKQVVQKARKQKETFQKVFKQADLKGKLQEMKEEIQQIIEQEREECKQNLNDLAKKLQNEKYLNIQLQKDIRRLKSDNQEKELKIQSISEHSQTVERNQKEYYEKQIKTIQDKLNQQTHKLQEEQSKAKKDISELQNVITQHLAEIELIKSEIEEKDIQIKAQENTVKAKDKEIKEIKKQLKLKDQENISIGNQTKEIQERINKQKEESEIQIKDLKLIIEQEKKQFLIEKQKLSQQLQEYQNQIENQNQNISKLNQTSSQLEKQFKQQQIEANASHENQIKSLRNEYEQKFSNFQKQQQEQFNKLKQDQVEKQNQLNSKTKEIEQLKLKLQQQEQKLREQLTREITNQALKQQESHNQINNQSIKIENQNNVTYYKNNEEEENNELAHQELQVEQQDNQQGQTNDFDHLKEFQEENNFFEFSYQQNKDSLGENSNKQEERDKCANQNDNFDAQLELNDEDDTWGYQNNSSNKQEEQNIRQQDQSSTWGQQNKNNDSYQEKEGQSKFNNEQSPIKNNDNVSSNPWENQFVNNFENYFGKVEEAHLENTQTTIQQVNNQTNEIETKEEAQNTNKISFKSEINENDLGDVWNSQKEQQLLEQKQLQNNTLNVAEIDEPCIDKPLKQKEELNQINALDFLMNNDQQIPQPIKKKKKKKAVKNNSNVPVNLFDETTPQQIQLSEYSQTDIKQMDTSQQSISSVNEQKKQIKQEEVKVETKENIISNKTENKQDDHAVIEQPQQNDFFSSFLPKKTTNDNKQQNQTSIGQAFGFIKNILDNPIISTFKQEEKNSKVSEQKQNNSNNFFSMLNPFGQASNKKQQQESEIVKQTETFENQQNAKDNIDHKQNQVQQQIIDKSQESPIKQVEPTQQVQTQQKPQPESSKKKEDQSFFDILSNITSKPQQQQQSKNSENKSIFLSFLDPLINNNKQEKDQPAQNNLEIKQETPQKQQIEVNVIHQGINQQIQQNEWQNSFTTSPINQIEQAPNNEAQNSIPFVAQSLFTTTQDKQIKSVSPIQQRVEQKKSKVALAQDQFTELIGDEQLSDIAPLQQQQQQKQNIDDLFSAFEEKKPVTKKKGKNTKKSKQPKDKETNQDIKFDQLLQQTQNKCPFEEQEQQNEHKVNTDTIQHQQEQQEAHEQISESQQQQNEGRQQIQVEQNENLFDQSPIKKSEEQEELKKEIQENLQQIEQLDDNIDDENEIVFSRTRSAAVNKEIQQLTQQTPTQIGFLEIQQENNIYQQLSKQHTQEYDQSNQNIPQSDKQEEENKQQKSTKKNQHSTSLIQTEVTFPNTDSNSQDQPLSYITNPNKEDAILEQKDNHYNQHYQQNSNFLLQTSNPNLDSFNASPQIKALQNLSIEESVNLGQIGGHSQNSLGLVPYEKSNTQMKFINQLSSLSMSQEINYKGHNVQDLDNNEDEKSINNNYNNNQKLSDSMRSLGLSNFNSENVLHSSHMVDIFLQEQKKEKQQQHGKFKSTSIRKFSEGFQVSSAYEEIDSVIEKNKELEQDQDLSNDHLQDKQNLSDMLNYNSNNEITEQGQKNNQYLRDGVAEEEEEEGSEASHEQEQNKYQKSLEANSKESEASDDKQLVDLLNNQNLDEYSPAFMSIAVQDNNIAFKESKFALQIESVDQTPASQNPDEQLSQQFAEQLTTQQPIQNQNNSNEDINKELDACQEEKVDQQKLQTEENLDLDDEWGAQIDDQTSPKKEEQKQAIQDGQNIQNNQESNIVNDEDLDINDGWDKNEELNEDLVNNNQDQTKQEQKVQLDKEEQQQQQQEDEKIEQDVNDGWSNQEVINDVQIQQEQQQNSNQNEEAQEQDEQQQQQQEKQEQRQDEDILQLDDKWGQVEDIPEVSEQNQEENIKQIVQEEEEQKQQQQQNLENIQNDVQENLSQNEENPKQEEISLQKNDTYDKVELEKQQQNDEKLEVDPDLDFDDGWGGDENVEIPEQQSPQKEQIKLPLQEQENSPKEVNLDYHQEQIKEEHLDLKEEWGNNNQIVEEAKQEVIQENKIIDNNDLELDDEWGNSSANKELNNQQQSLSPKQQNQDNQLLENNNNNDNLKNIEEELDFNDGWGETQEVEQQEVSQSDKLFENLLNNQKNESELVSPNKEQQQLQKTVSDGWHVQKENKKRNSEIKEEINDADLELDDGWGDNAVQPEEEQLQIKNIEQDQFIAFTNATNKQKVISPNIFDNLIDSYYKGDTSKISQSVNTSNILDSSSSFSNTDFSKISAGDINTNKSSTPAVDPWAILGNDGPTQIKPKGKKKKIVADLVVKKVTQFYVKSEPVNPFLDKPKNKEKEDEPNFFGNF